MPKIGSFFGLRILNSFDIKSKPYFCSKSIDFRYDYIEPGYQANNENATECSR